MRRHFAMACIAFGVVSAGTIIGWIAAPRIEAISASDASARTVDPGRGVAAIYLTISNRTATPDALIEVDVPPTVAQFVDSSAIELSPGATTRLAPGDARVILIGLSRPLHAGERFPITLEFRLAPRTTLQVTVESPSRRDP